jgi:hypothetical protein
MTTLEQNVKKIAVRRVRMLLEYELQYEGFMDASDVNRLAEDYGITYTQAWDLVRAEFKTQLKELA